MRHRAAVITIPVLLVLVLSLVVGCGGGGSGASGSPPPAPPPAGTNMTVRAALGTGDMLVPFATGTSAPQVTCRVDGVNHGACLATPDGIRVDYTDLAPGRYTFTIDVSTVAGSAPSRSTRVLEVVEPDVAVFAGTPGGLAAAIAAARAGATTVILESGQWLGGMMSGGLTATDIGPRGDEVMGGFPREYFRRLRDLENTRGACSQRHPCPSLYVFEPHVAEQLFERMVAEAGVIVERSVQLLSVETEDTRIATLHTSRGKVAASVFIDASYEGDLMALAGVSHTIGREPRTLAEAADPAQLAVQEDDAGVKRYALPRNLFTDPYVEPGNPASGTLPFIEPRPARFPAAGDGDDRVMAYTYRLCVTDDPGNRRPFTAPVGYDPAQYEASARIALALRARGADLSVIMFNPARTVRSSNRDYFKHDLNGGSTFSIDMTAPTLNQAWTLAAPAQRAEIARRYRAYIEGLLYFWQTDPRFDSLNQKVARFGYCQDEFTDRGGWPHQLYVRVARRMLGEYVVNQNDVFQNGRRPPVHDPIALGVYNVDLHTYRYLAAPVNWPDGTRRDAITQEGWLAVHFPNDEPYPIPYRSIVPRSDEITNLLNPVTLSATNVAYGSIRMEPTFMALGEAAGTAAALAVERDTTVQEVEYLELRRRLLASQVRLAP